MTKDELAAIQRGEPVITEQEQLADREPTEYADLNMADDFDRAVWQIREDYADAAEIESELRLAKLWAERVEVDYDEGPSAIGFHKDGSTYWYLIGDACWDADDPRSEMLAYVCKHWKCASDERDAVEATLATMHSDAHLAREAMAALTEDVAKQRAVIERLERERDEAHRQCHAWAESDKALRAKLEEERAAVGDGIICSVAAWNDVVGRRDQAIADASRLRAENEQLRRDRADVMTDLVARDRENERMRGLLVEAISFATCSGPDLNARYGRYLELCAIAGVALTGHRERAPTPRDCASSCAPRHNRPSNTLVNVTNCARTATTGRKSASASAATSKP